MWSVGLAPVILRGSWFDSGGGTTYSARHVQNPQRPRWPLAWSLVLCDFISIFLGFEEANFDELRNRYMFNTKHHLIPNMIV